MAEKEYIEREAVCKVISKEVNVQRLSYLPRKLELEGLKTVMNQVNKIPSADVVEVRHGEWIRKDGFLVCSECDATKPYAVLNDTINYWRCDYCNRCGAKMDGERKDKP